MLIKIIHISIHIYKKKTHLLLVAISSITLMKYYQHINNLLSVLVYIIMSVR